MRMHDVVVIGSGLAGLFAACIAAEQGKNVSLISYGAGALTVGGGIIDALGYTDDGKPVKNPSEAIKGLTGKHPYSKVGIAGVEQALQAFQRIAAAEGYPFIGDSTKNQWVATAIGALKPTCLTPKTMDGSALKEATKVLVVGFEGLKDFYADMVQKNLLNIYGERKEIRAVTTELPFEKGRDVRDISAMDIARWLDTEEGRAHFAGQMKQYVKPGMVLLMPPVLGTMPNYCVQEALERALGCRLIEVSSMPPALTGYRLNKMMTSYAHKLGVRFVTKAKVIGSHIINGVCKYVVTTGCGREQKHYGSTFILATGGVFGGGLATGMGEMTEPIFNIDIEVPKVQTEWSHKALFSDGKQIFAQYGVEVDKDLVPLTANGEKVAKNIRVVGRTLAGYDYCYEKSGNGVALATAYQAAMSIGGAKK